MAALAPLALIAAVLAGDEVVVVDTTSAVVVRRLALAAEGGGIFAAPDGCLIVTVPRAGMTLRVRTDWSVERWPGVLVPVFFDEPDRMYGLFESLLVTLSYPERLELARRPLPAVRGAFRAACSRDGQLLGIVPNAPDRRRLVVVTALGDTPDREIALASEVAHFAMAPGGMWLAAGLVAGAVEVVIAGEPRGRGPTPVGGQIGGLTSSSDGRDLFVGVADGKDGRIVCYRVSLKAKEALKRRFATELGAPVVALSAAGEEVVAATTVGLALLEKGGKRVRHLVPISGVQALALLPERAATVVPPWSG
ncbi:MAG: hypothetical protein V1750_06870 [Acidobacteriota bacterium]